jgi:hypothetical protein
VRITLPTSRNCTKRLWVSNARNLWITGGKFVFVGPDPAVIRVNDSQGITFIEGLHIDVNGRAADAIATLRHKGQLIVQNTFIEGVSGVPGGVAGDLIQAQAGGPLQKLILQNVTGLTGYRGLYTPYRSDTGEGAHKLVVERFNVGYDTSLSKTSGAAKPLVLIYLGSADNPTVKVPDLGSRLTDVYVDTRFWGLAYQKAVFVQPAPQAAGCATFPLIQDINGKVCDGDPPEGDYAPAALVGRNYRRSAFCLPLPTGDCDPRIVPANAAAAGLTHLAFCDDFKNPQVSLELSDRLSGEDKKWSRQQPFAYLHPEEDRVADRSSYVFNADGTMTFEPQGLSPTVKANYLWSAFKRDDETIGGFYIDREPGGSYLEIRWKYPELLTYPNHFPAFWSMDLCNLFYKNVPERYCNRHVELDVFEYMTGREVTASHYWADDKSLEPEQPSHYKITTCSRVAPDSIDRTTLHKNAVQVGSNGSFIRYYQNDATLLKEFTPSSACRIMDTTLSDGTGSFLLQLSKGRYAIVLGTGPGYPITVDYVRVWTKP